MKKPLLLLFTVTAILAGCTDAPTVGSGSQDSGDNLLLNSEFLTSNPSMGNLDATSTPHWLPAYYSPQISSGGGCQGKPGYIQIWGNSASGEGVMQELTKPLRKGKTYVVTACIKFWNDNPQNYTPYTQVRFVAFDRRPPGNGRWPDSTQGMAVIGTVRTGSETWQTYRISEWTADADYYWFAFNAENDNIGANSASWAHVDNVQLREKPTSDEEF